MEGCRLIQFETDNDHNVNDHEIKTADQSFYVIDSNQRVRRIVGCGDNSSFSVVFEASFKQHSLKKGLSLLNSSDWSTVHVDYRAITIDSRTYNLNSELSYDVEVPRQAM